MPSALQRRLDRLIARQETTIAAAFRAFVVDVKSERVLREIADLLADRNVEAALAVVDEYVIRMGPAISRVFQDVAQSQTDQLAPTLALRSRAAIVFDPTDRMSAEVMRNNQLRFIREFSQEQRRSTRQALSRALATGQSLRQAANSFKDSIGLTQYQENVVARYEQQLRAGNADALNRALRDRRRDASVRRAMRSGEPLSEKQITLLTTRYRDRYIAYRATTIARTESVRTTSIATREATRQALEDARLDPRLVIRVWNATQDDRTRDSHSTMDGQEAAIDQPFMSGLGNAIMFPGDPNAPAEEVINCRCVVTTRIKEAA